MRVVPGQWALVDDGYVAECTSRKTYSDARGRTRDTVTLSFGCAWVPRNKEFCFEPFLQSGHYGGTTPKHQLFLILQNQSLLEEQFFQLVYQSTQ